MKIRLLALPIVLALSSLPVAAQEKEPAAAAAPAGPEHSSSLQLEFTVTEGERIVAKGTIHGDFSGSRGFDGITTLRHLDGSRWVVEADLELASEKSEHSSARPATIHVEVSDLLQLRSPSGQSNTILPMEIFSTYLAYHGSGTYQLFSQGDTKVNVTVRHKETAAPAER